MVRTLECKKIEWINVVLNWLFLWQKVIAILQNDLKYAEIIYYEMHEVLI